MLNSNKSIDELVRDAECQNNSLAITILEAYEAENSNDDENTIDAIIGDTAQHFADEIDEKLTAYIRDTYYNPESDYFDFLYDMGIDMDQIKNYMDDNDIDLDIQVVEDRLECMLDYYCEVDITSNYSASRGISVAGGSIGEIEESMEWITDFVPAIYSDKEVQAQFYEYVLDSINAVYVHKDSEMVYIDMSSDFASLVIKTDMYDELFAPVED